MYYSLGKRSGAGYQITNATAVPCWNCFSYGFDIGVHVGNGAIGVNFTAGGSDNDYTLGDPTSIGILVDESASGAQFVGFGVDSAGRGVVADNSTNTNATPNAFTGGHYATTIIPGNYPGPSFELDSAWDNQISNVAVGGNILISDLVNEVQYGGINGPTAEPVFQSSIGQGKTQQDGSSIFEGGSPTVGSPAYNIVTAGTVNTTGRVNASGAISTSMFLRQAATTVSGLSTLDPLPMIGDRAIVTDAPACTFGSALTTGGGSLKCPIFYNGSNWVAG